MSPVSRPCQAGHRNDALAAVAHARYRDRRNRNVGSCDLLRCLLPEALMIAEDSRVSPSRDYEMGTTEGGFVHTFRCRHCSIWQTKYANKTSRTSKKNRTFSNKCVHHGLRRMYAGLIEHLRDVHALNRTAPEVPCDYKCARRLRLEKKLLTAAKAVMGPMQ
jgi:hypothetical protein